MQVTLSSVRSTYVCVRDLLAQPRLTYLEYLTMGAHIRTTLSLLSSSSGLTCGSSEVSWLPDPCGTATAIRALELAQSEAR